MGQAKNRGTLAERVAQAKQKQKSLKPTFYKMIHEVASGQSGNNEQNKLAVRMMIQSFVMAGGEVWTDPKVTQKYYGMSVTPEQYWNFVEWYNGAGGSSAVNLGGDKPMPFVPISGELKLYNHTHSHNMINEDTDGWKIQEIMMSSMIYWLSYLCKNDPEYPLLQYSVLVNEDLLGTDQHKQGVKQATIVNLGPFRLVMIENEQHTELTIKDNPDWEDYCGKNNIKH